MRALIEDGTEFQKEMGLQYIQPPIDLHVPNESADLAIVVCHQRGEPAKTSILNLSRLRSVSYNPKRKISKFKRGLASFVNGARLSVVADTGATKNVISKEYAEERKMAMEKTSYSFQLGNSSVVKSMGTVVIDYAFAEEPSKTYKLVCHVLPECTYDLILGKTFLLDTETLSKHRRRLTECLFSVVNMFHFSFLGNDCQLLKGKLADLYPAYALPDTGAERNVMDFNFALQHGLEVFQSERDRGCLQFADGTIQETVGRVHTYWTFDSGDRIPITFEVLENCCHDVILGEDVLWNHDVFSLHTASMITAAQMDELERLAPFRYERRLEKFFGKGEAEGENTDPQPTATEFRAAEEERRRHWDYTYGFDGAKATTVERVAEEARRARYEAELGHSRHPLVPSIPTANTIGPYNEAHQPLSQSPQTSQNRTTNSPQRHKNRLRKYLTRLSGVLGQRSSRSSSA